MQLLDKMDFRITPKLKFKKRRRLVEVLLECSCMNDDQRRNSVVNDLQPEISRQIARNLAKQMDVDSIVQTCLAYPGGIEDLLEIVHYYEIGSNAAQRLIEVALEVLSPILISEQLLDELRQNLNSLKVPPDQFHRLYRKNLPEGKSTPRLPNTVYQAFLELFEFDKPSQSLLFIEQLAEQQTGTALKQTLQHWVEKAATELGTTREKLQIRLPLTAVGASPYLMIMLRPARDAFTLQAWLWKNNDEIIPLRTEDEPCTLVRIEEIVQEIVTDIGNCYPNFIVELFVPRQLFTYDLTRWKILIGTTPVSLVTQNPVVLRWLPRAIDVRYQGRWQSKWKEVRQAAHLNGDALVFCITHAEHYTDESLLAELAQPNKGICIGLGFVPPPVTSEHTRDLLKVILDAGIPIVLWFHQPLEGQTVVEQQIKTLLCNRKLQSLPQLAWELWNKAATNLRQDQICPCLMVLYDDVERLPPVLQLGAPLVARQ